MTRQEQAELAELLRHSWPGWTIWRTGRTWYATGCAVPGCRSRRTLHALGLIRLCERLREEKARTRKGTA
ncbi:hypothetical protein Ppa06_61070 [Planomonospora parontospora subsp. parontospora]|uniref:Uncharacterized protein n=2 Tax=Planomonospora parontospora TaxID=58119 RepID=A0AA37BF55_9ACTN|nr:hypothetical protein [Planomonospora parontospora]GGK62109.1 hypothetical protein GCM10010126_21870 [Planomonospora parontospora]GII12309.1 hypothetical protein Ppa06_61070 [Planomonospora parontospora subsp. parontospora]